MKHLCLHPVKKKKEYKGTYKKNGTQVILYFYKQKMTLTAESKEVLYGTSGALTDKTYQRKEKKSSYCKLQKSVVLEHSLEKEKIVANVPQKTQTQDNTPASKRWKLVDNAPNISKIKTDDEPTICVIKGMRFLNNAKHENASQQFKTCCEKFSDSRSCHEHASYLDIHGSDNLADEYYNKACTLKYGRACFVVARTFLQRGLKSESISFFEKGCAFGYISSCNFVRQ